MPKLLLPPIFQFIDYFATTNGPVTCHPTMQITTTGICERVDRAALTTILHLVKVNKYKNSNIITESAAGPVRLPCQLGKCDCNAIYRKTE